MVTLRNLASESRVVVVDEYVRQYVHTMTTNRLLSVHRHGSMSSPWPSTLQNELFEQFTSQNPQDKG